MLAVCSSVPLLFSWLSQIPQAATTQDVTAESECKYKGGVEEEEETEMKGRN